ncbi:MAG: SMC family ATPase [Nanoarchaeota archaeon]|nr:SMC family ATPase [Nanoarchaeota archaeon]
MILLSIRLFNIRSYISEKIIFPKGRVLLSGDIGSGKSTILLAVEFALFGIRRGELSGNSLLRHGENKGEVELEMDIDGTIVIIRRNLKRSKNSIVQDSGYVIIDGKKTEGTPIELKSKILEVLSYPEEMLTKSKSLIYRYTVYMPQEEMKQILLEEKEVRLDTLRKVFGIDKYKRIRENALMWLRDFKSRIVELEARIADFDEIVSQKRERQHESAEIDLKVNEIDSELKKIVLDIKKKEEEKISLRKRAEKAAILRSKLENKNTKITEKSLQKIQIKEKLALLTEEVKSIGKELAIFEKYKEKINEEEQETKCSEKEKEYNRMINRRDVLLERLEAIEKQVADTEKRIQDQAVRVKEVMVKKIKKQEVREKLQDKEKLMFEKMQLSKKLEILKASISKKEIENVNAEEIVREIKDLSKCPTCLQHVDENHKHKVMEKQRDIRKTAAEFLAKYTQIVPKVEKMILRNEKLIEENHNMEKQLAKMDAEIAAMEKDSDQMIKDQIHLTKLVNDRGSCVETLDGIKEKDLDKIKLELEEDNRKIRDIRENNIGYIKRQNLVKMLADKTENIELHNREMLVIKKDIAELTLEAKEIGTELKTYGDVEEKLFQTEKEIRDLMQKEKENEIKRAGLVSEKRAVVKQIGEFEKKTAEKSKIKIRIAEQKEIREWLEQYLVNLMSNIEKHVMASIYYEFNSILSKWFSMLRDDIDLKLDEEFSLNIYQDGYETEYGNLSGGEKTSIALAYRLALNKVVTDLISRIRTRDLLILDEPTYGFSSEQLDKVRDVFEELDMSQVILVSHEQKMESFVDHIIRIGKSEGKSHVYY